MCMKGLSKERLKWFMMVVLVCLGSPVLGQLTTGINYQAMALDTAGDPIRNQTIRLRFGIVEGSVGGPLTFQENHLTTTDDKGIFSLRIGTGMAEFNTMDSVNWQSRPVFLKIEMDESGGTNYSFVGFVEFADVPYALYAEYGRDEDADPTNEIQQLSLNGDTLSISNGNALRLPVSMDHLGNHTASQNLSLGTFWLSGDGDDEGLKIDEDGTVRSGNIEVQNTSTLFADQQNNSGFAFPIIASSPAIDNVMVGIESGNRFMTGSSNTLMGYRSGQQLSTGRGNVYLGKLAGNSSTAAIRNVAIGRSAGELNEYGLYNVFVGDESGMKAKGSFNTLIGKSAGRSLQTGVGNVFLGINAGINNETGNQNVFLGSRAGTYEMGSERLYIENSDSSSPLIYGEFDSDFVRVNGYLDVTGDITIDGEKIDADSTNELQTLSLSGDTLSISDGNSVILANEGQSGLTIDFGVFQLHPPAQGNQITVNHDLGVVPGLLEINWGAGSTQPANAGQGTGIYDGVNYAAISISQAHGHVNTRNHTDAIIVYKGSHLLLKAIVSEMTSSYFKLKIVETGHPTTFINGTWKVFK